MDKRRVRVFRDKLLGRRDSLVGQVQQAEAHWLEASEALEAFGGAGYLEDTGLPRLLRDAQVLSIWEGTTNILSLDALRAMERSDALPEWASDVRRRLSGIRVAALSSCTEQTLRAVQHIEQYAARAASAGVDVHATHQRQVEHQAAVAHGAHDPRIRVAAFNHASTYFADAVWHGQTTRHIRQGVEAQLDLDRLRGLWLAASPMVYFDKFARYRKKSLVIYADYDLTFLPEFSRQVVAEFARQLRITQENNALRLMY